MKRILSVLLLAAALLGLVGCSSSGSGYSSYVTEDPAVETYKQAAQRLIDSGNLEGALEILEEAVDKTSNWELRNMLTDVRMMISQEAISNMTVPSTEAPTPIPTEPPATAAPTLPQEPVQETFKLSNVQYRINVFLSNFAEAFFSDYPCDKRKMLEFAYLHAMLNDDGEIKYDGDTATMSEEDVNHILYKYFGVTFEENGEPAVYQEQNYSMHVHYDGNNYKYYVGSGEHYGYVAVASTMEKNSDGTYTVKYDVYCVERYHEDYDSDVYFKLNSREAMGRSDLTYCYSGTAVVRDYLRTNGKQSYQLLRMDRDY